MIPIVGKNGTAKILTDERDELAISHLYNIMSYGLTEGSTVRVMADYHEGKGAVIGFTQRLNKDDPRICPNVVGVDIGCRVSALELKNCKPIDYEKLDAFIRNNIPLGAGNYATDSTIKKSAMAMAFDKSLLEVLKEAYKMYQLDGGYSTKTPVCDQLFSLGSGNHYIEIDQSESTGNFWLNVHSGSRNFGLQVATLYQKKAEEYCKDKCPLELRYLDKGSEYYSHYLSAVQACQLFSELNHTMILKILQRYLYETCGEYGRFSEGEHITTLHNYIDLDELIVRKGAISARAGEVVLIPLNMRDGMAVAVGKGNEDYNWSAPHGCGRLMSRSQAKKSLDAAAVKQGMVDAGVFTTSVEYSLDEAADAYKDKDTVLDCIKDTVEIREILKPVYNIKGK